MPGSSPSRIPGYPQDDGLGNKDRKETTGLDLPWFTQIANKAPVFQGVILKEEQREKRREKEKRTTWGDQASVSEAHNFIFKRNFYTLTCTQREMKDAKSYRVSSNIPAVLPLLKPGFFLHTFPINKGLMLCTLSSGLGGLLTFYDPFLTILSPMPSS